MSRWQNKNLKLGVPYIDSDHTTHLPLHSMKNSSTVDVLFETFSSKQLKQNSTSSIPTVKSQPKKNLFKLAESLINNEFQSTQQFKILSQRQNQQTTSNPNLISNNLPPNISSNTNFKKKSNKQNQQNCLPPSQDIPIQFANRLKQIKFEISQKLIQLEISLRNEVTSNRNTTKQLQRGLQQLSSKLGSQYNKQKQTTGNMKQEYRKAFTKLVEQINNKFVSMDRNILNIRQQAQINDVQVTKKWQQTNHKIEQVNAYCINLEERINNYIKIDNFDQQQYLISLKQSRDLNISKNCNQEQVLTMNNAIQKLKKQVLIQNSNCSEAINKGNIREQINNILKEKHFRNENQIQQRVKFEDSIKKNWQMTIEQYMAQKGTVMMDKLKQLAKVDESKKLYSDLVKIKQEFENRLGKNQIIYIRKSEQILQKIEKTKSMNSCETFFLDNENYLLDSVGNYLVNDKNQRIKVLEDEIYMLEAQGIPILNII